MAEKEGKRSWVRLNRAPVLTLWAAVVVAEVLEREGLEYCLLQESLRKLFENWENTSNYKFPSPISLVDIPRNSLRWGRISIDRIGGLGVF